MKSSQQVEHGHNETRRVSERSVGYRIAGPIVVLLVLMFGYAEWVRYGLDTRVPSEQPQAQTAPDRALVEAYRATLDAAE